jgi:DNA mismatch endonuclease (patch repair protein)
MRNAPSYKEFRPSSEKASRTASKIKASDTKAETTLRSTLWRKGLRFRKNVRTLPGRPDVVFPRARLAVFCDGDFWHGRDWESRLEKLRRGSNSTYWVAKIKANMERDLRHNEALRQLGWQVLRLWEKDILGDPDGTSARVIEALQKATSGRGD